MNLFHVTVMDNAGKVEVSYHTFTSILDVPQKWRDAALKASNNFDTRREWRIFVYPGEIRWVAGPLYGPGWVEKAWLA